MNPYSAPARYTRTAVLLHWLTAALIFAAFPLGWIVDAMRLSPLKLQLVSYHKWIGVTVLLLAAARLLWRLAHRPPPLAAQPAWQRRAAGVVHAAFYALLLALPVSGWLYSSAAGVPTVYLGLWQLPDLVARDRALAAALRDAHEAIGVLLLALVAVHLAAVVKHQFVDRDGLLQRMRL